MDKDRLAVMTPSKQCTRSNGNTLTECPFSFCEVEQFHVLANSVITAMTRLPIINLITCALDKRLQELDELPMKDEGCKGFFFDSVDGDDGVQLVS